MWAADEAYIMDENGEDFDKEDIGIVIISKFQDTFFFNSDDLKSTEKLYRAPIVPACLIGKNVNLEGKSLKTAGWGLTYDESPQAEDKTNRNPILSSCMTSQASPEKWRFQNCDMRWMKDMNARNRWKCDTKNPPPTYETEQMEQCTKYFNEVVQIIGNTEVARKQLDEVDILVIVDNNDKAKGTNVCYNPTSMKKYGWCELLDNPENTPTNPSKSWGICGPSCNPKLMKVISFHI